jgi:NTP pyrophosphatase (non-canonical NTP hydrolase)
MYEQFVKDMKVFPEKHAIVYPALGLTGEAGEVAEKVKKWLRGDKKLDREAVLKELGDVQWYNVALALDLGYTFEDILVYNMAKLRSRQERGVQKGDGDER